MLPRKGFNVIGIGLMLEVVLKLTKVEFIVD